MHHAEQQRVTNLQWIVEVLLSPWFGKQVEMIHFVVGLPVRQLEISWANFAPVDFPGTVVVTFVARKQLGVVHLINKWFAATPTLWSQMKDVSVRFHQALWISKCRVFFQHHHGWFHCQQALNNVMCGRPATTSVATSLGFPLQVKCCQCLQEPHQSLAWLVDKLSCFLHWLWNISTRTSFMLSNVHKSAGPHGQRGIVHKSPVFQPIHIGSCIISHNKSFGTRQWGVHQGSIEECSFPFFPSCPRRNVQMMFKSWSMKSLSTKWAVTLPSTGHVGSAVEV